MNISTVIEHTTVINNTLKKYGLKLIVLNRDEFQKFAKFMENDKDIVKTNTEALKSKLRIKDYQIKELSRQNSRLNKNVQKSQNIIQTLTSAKKLNKYEHTKM